MTSQRSRAILDMVPAKRNNNLSTTSSKVKKLELSKLYSQPYSMISPVFKNFCETQTTLSSHHFNNLSHHIIKLNEIFPASKKEKATEKPLDLICHEEMIPSDISIPQELCEFNSENIPTNDNLPLPSISMPTFDFDSDDSVRDKDYIPNSSESSSDDDADMMVSSNQKALVASTSAKSAPLHLLQPLDRSKISHIKKRRNTDDFHVLRNPGSKILASRRRNTIHTMDGGPIIKRKRISKTEKNIEKMEKMKNKYVVKSGCTQKCLKKCFINFSEERRQEINNEYWSLTWEQRKQYVRSQIDVAVPKRKYTSEPKRNAKRCFKLKCSEGILREVCKAFFLTTLGFKKDNDRVLRLNDDVIDKRGKHTKTPAYDRQLLVNHVESFHPYAPHHRREHAPLKRYLPSELNIRHMHKDYCNKNTENTVSYELYRKNIKSMNISFTRLGNEDCETCESYFLHRKQTSHDALTQLVIECTKCVDYSQHHVKYTKARQLYAEHKALPQNKNQIFYSGDLEKVIMLPRLDTFKSIIFCPRLIAFNQTFAPLGKITNENKPVTVVWHDAIAGRKQEDIMSAFYLFFIRNRDVRNINIWLDNCGSQNKNWLLFSLLIHLVNSDLISTKKISLYYFEPGHTFMSADQVHHQVELAMKKKGKLYDFQDFVDAVSSINNSKVIVESPLPRNFINIPNLYSDRRIQNSVPRAYLKNMVHINFKRNDFDLHYKNDWDGGFNILRFMNDRYLKNPNIMNITYRDSPKGIEPDRKRNIINKLDQIIPKHKLLFWKNIPECDANEASTSDIRKKKTI